MRLYRISAKMITPGILAAFSASRSTPMSRTELIDGVTSTASGVRASGVSAATVADCSSVR